MIIQENLSDGLHLSIAQSCQALEVSRYGYYKWTCHQRSIPFPKDDDVVLKDEIQDIILEFPGYGRRGYIRPWAINHLISSKWRWP